MEENAKKNTKCIDVYGNIGLRRISSQRTAQTLMRSTTRWVDVWDVVQSRLHIAQHTDEMKQHLLHVWHRIYQSIIDKYICVPVLRILTPTAFALAFPA